MSAVHGNKRAIVAVMLVIAVLAVAIPTCEMIGCDMSSMCGGMMTALAHPGPTFNSPCGGTWVTNGGQIGVVSSEMLTALMALMAFVAAFFLFSPRVHFEPVRFVDAHAPPPPLEPCGERRLL